MLTDQLRIVKDGLKAKHIYVKDEWLESAAASLSALSFNTNHIYRRWLFADIRLACASDGHFIPPDLCIPGTVEPKTLEGTYAVQLVSVCNATAPIIDDENEFMRLEEPEEFDEADSDEDKGKPREAKSKAKVKGPRLLSLMITDGEKECKAIEYQKIEILNEKLSVGTKLLLKGPIEIQWGIMFLTAVNVEILGGKLEKSENQPRVSRLSLLNCSPDAQEATINLCQMDLD